MYRKKGAVLIEVLVALFITAVVFIAVYTTISICLVNTKYLQQIRKTSDFSSQLYEALRSSADSNSYTLFDFVTENYDAASGRTQIDLDGFYGSIENAEDESLDFRTLIDNDAMNDYSIELFLLSSNAVYMCENSLGTPFGSAVYSPDENLRTFELKVQQKAKDWGYNGFSIYKERKPAVINYVFQIARGQQ